MNQTTNRQQLEDSLAEGIAAVMAADMAADAELGPPEDMADLFLEELNRLWLETPDTEQPAAQAA